MQKETTIDTKIIGYTTIAVLMGMGFAAAMNVQAYAGSLNISRNAHQTGHRSALATAPAEDDYVGFAAMVNELEPPATVPTEQFMHMQDRREARAAHNEELEALLTTGDYTAWTTYIDAHPRISEVIAVDNFDRYIAMHRAHAIGDLETAREIRTELGLPLGKRWYGAGE